MSVRKFALLSLFLILLIPYISAQTVSVYTTTPDFSQALHHGANLTFGSSGSGSVTITINDGKTYQQMDGFGASFTDTSAWLMYNKLSSTQRAAAMQMLFDRSNGIALGFLRQPMGSSDEAVTFYSYDDLCTQTTTACSTPSGTSDPTLAHFSIAHDEDYIIPVLQQAIALNPNIKIMANPWSPPGWMKTNGTMLGVDSNNNTGSLRSDSYAPLANYFVKFLQAYQADGVPVDYISMQNEPLYTPPSYAGMAMTSAEQANFLANYLGPALQTAGLKTKVLVYDHNWDQWNYATNVLSNSTAYSFAAGSAFHHYAGDPAVMSTVHDKFPAMGIWETEASGGTWQTEDVMAQEAQELINSTRNWAKSYVLWNMALDQNHGPVIGGCNTCRGVITIDSSDPNNVVVKPELDYYVLGQASKFVMPGALRIDSDEATTAGIYDVAFRNPDGSIVVYALNKSTSDKTINVKHGSQVFTATIKAGSISTFTWAPAQSPAVSLSADPNGMSLQAGKNGAIDIAVQPLNGATPNVTFSCTGAPATTACSVTPGSIAFSSSTAQTVSVSITTTGSSAAMGKQMAHRRSHLPLFAAFGLPLLGCCAVFRKPRWLALLFGSALLLTLVSCGGGGSSTGGPIVPITPPSSGTSPGTYQFTVTATPDSGAATSMTVFVTVQ